GGGRVLRAAGGHGRRGRGRPDHPHPLPLVQRRGCGRRVRDRPGDLRGGDRALTAYAVLDGPSPAAGRAPPVSARECWARTRLLVWPQRYRLVSLPTVLL